VDIVKEIPSKRKAELNHKEVQKTADRVAKSFKKLVTEIIAGM